MLILELGLPMKEIPTFTRIRWMEGQTKDIIPSNYERIRMLSLHAQMHNLDWASSSTFFLERRGTAGQAPSFLFSSLSSSVCQLLCANSLKRPSSSLCQKSVWQSRWAKTWLLQSESLGDIYQFWRAEKTVERWWNKPLNIWIICSAQGPSWNDRKQHSHRR